MAYVLSFKVLFLLTLFQCAKPQDCQSQQFGRTLEEGATGASVVEATISKITESGIFSNDFGFLRRMASFETDNGATATPGGGGIWRVSATVLNLINSFISVPLSPLPDIEDNIEKKFCFRWSNTVGNSLQRLDTPLYSALAVMMAVIIASDEKFPKYIPSQAQLWRGRFNPLGNIDDFISHANFLEIQAQDCQIRGVDMIFVMDESGSIGSIDFEKMKELAINITDAFAIGPKRTQVGWINFNKMARVVFNLSTYPNKTSLHNAMRGVLYFGGSTNIGAGLQALYDYGFVESAGYRNSFLVPEVAIVLTDGRSDLEPIEDAAALLHENRSIDIFVIGVGDGVEEEQIEAVARAGVATDINSTVFLLEGFGDDELNRVKDVLRARICINTSFAAQGVKVERLNADNISIDMGEIVHVIVECPPEGLTINVCAQEGKTIVYISRSTSSPSSINNDEMLPIDKGKCRNIFIKCSTNRRKRQVTDKIFMGIEGAAEENVFDINASKGDSSTPQVNLVCEAREGSDGQSVVVSCVSDRELTQILCSVNSAPFNSCALPWVENFTPPITHYSLQVTVTDTLNLTESTTVEYQVLPLMLDCSVDAESIICTSNNELDTNKTLCSFNDDTAVPCTLPYDIHHTVKGLPVGDYFFTMTATDVFGSTVQSVVEYYVVEDRVGDDVVMTVALDIRPYELGVTDSKTVSLCYQVHGEPGKAYNLLSDECLSVNAHLGKPDVNVDANVIDIITIRATGSNGTCYDIVVMRPNCAVYVNNQMIPLNNFFEEEHVFVFNKKKFARKPTVAKVKVPNCGRHIVNHMLITCTDYHIQHSTMATEVLEFKTV